MSFKKILTNIGNNILLGILFFGLMCIVTGIKVSKNNWIFLSIGTVLLLPYIIYYFWVEKETDKIEKQLEKEFQQFLKTADRVHVFLDDAIIKEKKHTETNTITQDNRAAALNEISGNGHYNEERITYTYCEVTFKVNYKGQKLTIKEVIHKDETSVQMHFYTQKVTTFYINPNDMNEIYLDLTFINN